MNSTMPRAYCQGCHLHRSELSPCLYATALSILKGLRFCTTKPQVRPNSISRLTMLVAVLMEPGLTLPSERQLPLSFTLFYFAWNSYFSSEQAPPKSGPKVVLSVQGGAGETENDTMILKLFFSGQPDNFPFKDSVASLEWLIFWIVNHIAHHHYQPH